MKVSEYIDTVTKLYPGYSIQSDMRMLYVLADIAVTNREIVELLKSQKKSK